MRTLSIEKMEVVEGGTAVACAATVIGGNAAIWGLAISIASGGVLAPLGVVVSVVGLAATLVGGAGTCAD